MKDLDMLDLFVSVLVCLALLPISINMIHRQESLMNKSNTMEDKNVKWLTDSNPDSEISGKDYSAWEVLLTTQIQSYYMSKPKALSIMGQDDDIEMYLSPIDISATFKEDRDVFIEQFRDHMNRVDGLKSTVELQDEDGEKEQKQVVTRYRLLVNQGQRLNTSEDDFYYFRKVD